MLDRLPGIDGEIVAGQSVIGGGSTPAQSIPTFLLALRTPGLARVEARLRGNHPPVVARIEAGRLLIDLRTVDPTEERALTDALQAALLADA